MLLTPWRTSAPVTTTLGMFHDITAWQTDCGLTMKKNFLNKKTVINIVADTMAHISTCNYNTWDVLCHYCLTDRLRVNYENFFLNKKTVTNIVADSMAHISTCNYNHVITACVLDQFMFVTNFAEKKSLQLHIGRGNYQQLKADKPCEHVRHRVTQGLIFTQSETAEIRLTFCIEITNPGMQVSYIHTSDWIHGYSELSAPRWWCHQMETFSTLLALCAGNSPVTSEFPSQRPVTKSS